MHTIFLADINLLWIYDLSNWLFCAVVVGVFVAFSLTGQIVVRRFHSRWFGDKEYNFSVADYLSAAGVFFGITLGLISVATWENFTAVDGIVSHEASAVGVLFRTVDNYPEPHRTVLTGQLRDYTRYTIDKSWPLYRQGDNSGTVGDMMLTRFYKYLAKVEPGDEAQKVLYGEALREFSNVLEGRRQRLDSVTTALPEIVWIVVIGGSVLSISLMWLFVIENRRLHDALTVTLACLLGLLVFLLASMDHPFRGEYSVGPDSFELVYDQLMKD